MSRAIRLAMRAVLRTQAEGYPASLTEIPESEWLRVTAEGPRRVWRSREFLAQLYLAPSFAGQMVLRLTVNRVHLGADGHWLQDITWEELQRVKRECGYGNYYGIEVYPREADVVRDCNMRHLWLFAEPLAIGWTKEGP